MKSSQQKLAYVKEWRRKKLLIDPHYQKETRKQYMATYMKTEKYIKHNRNHARIVMERRRKILFDMKSGPCMDCGNKFPPYVMEFDHRNPLEKKFSVSNYGFVSEINFQNELKKCDVVCANCHRVRTHKQRLAGFFRKEGYVVSERIQEADQLVLPSVGDSVTDASVKKAEVSQSWIQS